MVPTGVRDMTRQDCEMLAKELRETRPIKGDEPLVYTLKMAQWRLTRDAIACMVFHTQPESVHGGFVALTER